MYANDFEFDGRYLSDYGFVICDIGSDMDMNQVSAGGTVTIQTVRHGNGKRVFPVNATYESCIEADFTICKDPCVYNDTEISDDEMRDLMRWLNRRTYYKMRFLKEPENDDGGCFYNAAFNIDKICVGGKTVGLTLHMITDSPFGYGNEVIASSAMNYWDNTLYNTYVSLDDPSDDIGYIYPDMKLAVMSPRRNVEDSYTAIDVYNEMYPDERFRIDADFTHSLGKTYIVDGKSLAITEVSTDYTINAFDNEGNKYPGVEDVLIYDSIISKLYINQITNDFEPGLYRFVVADVSENEKKCILKKKKNDDTWETLRDNISCISSNHIGPIISYQYHNLIGGVIGFTTYASLASDSYLEMEIKENQSVPGDSFNYCFIKIGNTMDNRENVVRCTVPCSLELRYNPIIKLSP